MKCTKCKGMGLQGKHEKLTVCPMCKGSGSMEESHQEEMDDD